MCIRASGRSQAPRSVQMQSKYREKGLVVLGISLDESPEPVREFQGELKVKYRLALGDDEVAKRWGGILGLPVAFVVDRGGRLRERREGESERARGSGDPHGGWDGHGPIRGGGGLCGVGRFVVPHPADCQPSRR